MHEALPQRAYGTHWPRAFYATSIEKVTFRGVAPAPVGCRIGEARRLDVEQLRRLRDGLRRLGEGHAA